jgi:hypothetical protein
MHRVLKREREIPPRNRLEGWLARKIQAGVLKTLPRYNPLHGRGGECPEQYARALLTGLQSSEGDAHAVERLKDDGRAFRSWTESVLPAVAVPQGGQGRGIRLAHGFAN